MSKLKCSGVGRDKDNEQFLFFAFSRKPTDDEMRYLHEVMERAAVCSPCKQEPELRIVKP